MAAVTVTDAFTEAAARSSLAAACDQAGLSTAGARLLRLGENAIYHLPSHDIVVRIARAMKYWDDVAREVAIGRWLEDSRFPAVRVARSLSQPVKAAERPVTFWAYIDGRNGAPSDVAALGRLLRNFHQLPRPDSFALPQEDILGRVRGRMETAPVPGPDRDFLLGRLDHLSAELPRLRFPLSPCVTHGDAHVQNLMVTSDEHVLIDFERCAWGQPEWDLAMTATEFVTAGWWTADQYDAFCISYGWDVTDWEGFATLRATHELKMTSWLAQNVDQAPEIRREFETRMRTLRGDSNARDWQPY